MQYLLDTNVLLWWLVEPKKIRPKARSVIANRDNKIFISSVSMWEMALKKDIGKLTIPHNILNIIASESIQILPLGAEEGLGVADLPKLHNDPFDRILIMQAKFNDLILITSDQKIIQYHVITLEA